MNISIYFEGIAYLDDANDVEHDGLAGASVLRLQQFGEEPLPHLR